MIAGCHGSWQRNRASEEEFSTADEKKHKNGCRSSYPAGSKMFRVVIVVDVVVLRLLPKQSQQAVSLWCDVIGTI